MEEKNEILTAMREGFARVDERFGEIDQRLGRIEGEVSTLSTDVSALSTGVSQIREETHKAHIKIEELTHKVDLVAENVVDMRAYIARYDANVEAPLEKRVAELEGRVWVLEQKK